MMTSPRSLQQIKSFAKSRNLPLIPVEAKDLAIISDPKLFYNTILGKIRTTSEKLALTALYIGIGPKEDAIIESICEQKRKCNNLDVHIVLDANRASRVNSGGDSSLTTLRRLLEFDKVKLSLFNRLETNTIGRWLSKFQKWNELTTTFHSKVLIFDNDVLITGANLSDIYFDKRQDRYLLFKNSNPLAGYFYDLLTSISNTDINIKTLISKHNSNYIRENTQELNQDSDTYVIPLTQFGSSGLRDKEEFLSFLDKISPKDAKVYLSTGYFNPSSTINKLRLSSVLGPSEEANGFYNGERLLKYLPRLYSALARRYLSSHRNCDYFEYDRPGWSYHAKGIWYENFGDLYIHVVGSSNFNYRSANRDFETQLVVLTRNSDLIERLQEERARLWQESRRLTVNRFGNLNFMYHFVANLVRTYL